MAGFGTARRVAVAGQCVQHQHCVGVVGGERPPRFVRDRDGAETAAGLERERPIGRERVGELSPSAAGRRDATRP